MALEQEHRDEWIAKFLAGEASETEKAELKNWMAASEENEKYYAEGKRIVELAGKIFTSPTIDTDQAWNAFRERLPDPVTKNSVVRRIFVSVYSRAAAILLLAASGYFLYQRFVAAKKEISLVAPSYRMLSTTLPDGSYISLDQKSTITYGAGFNEKNRELTLSGKAYFRIQHQELPFIINTGGVFTKDIGTAFTLIAHPSDSVVTVDVEEGTVVFYSALHPGITLNQDETGIYNKTSGTFRKKVALSTDLTLKFDNATLKSVVDTLNNRFNAHVALSCKKLGDLKLTATFKGGLPATEETINTIVATIAETFNLSISKTQDSILLDSESCNK